MGAPIRIVLHEPIFTSDGEIGTPGYATRVESMTNGGQRIHAIDVDEDGTVDAIFMLDEKIGGTCLTRDPELKKISMLDSRRGMICNTTSEYGDPGSGEFRLAVKQAEGKLSELKDFLFTFFPYSTEPKNHIKRCQKTTEDVVCPLVMGGLDATIHFVPKSKKDHLAEDMLLIDLPAFARIVLYGNEVQVFKKLLRIK